MAFNYSVLYKYQLPQNLISYKQTIFRGGAMKRKVVELENEKMIFFPLPIKVS